MADGPPFRHALVLHGTGMLRAVSLGLSVGGRPVSVVARTREDLDRLARAALKDGGLLLPLVADTDDVPALVGALVGRMDEAGPIDRVLAWGVPAATLSAIGAVIAERGSWHLFHIRGSVAADPADPLAAEVRQLESLRGVTYHRIILGWSGPAGRARWLTREEIAAGVLSAVSRGKAEAVVGRVRPWQERPDW